MKSLKYLSVGIAVVAMIGFTAVAVIASIQIIEHLLAPSVHDAAYYKFCQDVFKTVIVGLVIGALGIVIPAFLTYSRDKFERLQNSRVAYSSAKTGVDYLALRLSALNLSKAGRLIQDVHFQKHQAQLYEKELKVHLKLRYDSPISPDVWDTAMYRKLRNARVLLKHHAE
jgi:hypothetical protein